MLPSGSQLKGGTLSAELGIIGFMDKLVITGPVRLANTKLTGFDLGSKLGALSAFAGKAASNPDTSIQNASLNARVAPAGTKADNINLTVPTVGVITGAGTAARRDCHNFSLYEPEIKTFSGIGRTDKDCLGIAVPRSAIDGRARVRRSLPGTVRNTSSSTIQRL